VRVHRSVIIGGAAVVLAAVVGLVVVLNRSEPEPAPAAAVAETPAARPVAPAPVPDAAPAPAAPRAPRRAEAPRAEAAPETAPAPVEAVPDVGTLRIEADVPGAQVFLDRQFIGAVPVVAENVKPGSHTLNVSAEGFDSIVQSIEVEPGSRDITVKFREVRLDARVDVIHKHGIGSCRGRLVATAQGLRYETANRDDSFAVALPDMETFQVDYLEKNLRVKLRRGKQFNFTDPDGNADRLFVFHRDVEKARERLRRGDTPAAD
jgi:hypothetical protein